MSSPSSNNADDDAWLIQIETKREELGEINKGDRIKKAAEDQAPAAEEEDILQPHYNLLTPTEIEAFKMIEIARVQNKYLTRENILLQEHIIALKAITRKLENLLCLMLDDKPASSTNPSSPPPKKRSKYMGMGTPLGNCQAWGRCPDIVSYHHHTSIFTIFLSSLLLVISWSSSIKFQYDLALSFALCSLYVIESLIYIIKNSFETRALLSCYDLEEIK